MTATTRLRETAGGPATTITSGVHSPIKERALGSEARWTLHEDSCRLFSRLDVVISVIHCAQCSSHMCVRHDEMEYVQKAQYHLRKLSKIVHSGGICARVGLLRVPLSSGHLQGVWEDRGPEGSRTGAFEISVILRDSRGDLRSSVLFSRLEKGKWPVTATLDRRLQSFLSPYITTNTQLVIRSPQIMTCDKEEGRHYPIGACDWKHIKTSDKEWQCEAFITPPRTQSTTTDISAAVMKSVQWLFDTRCEVSPSSIPLLWTATKDSAGDRPIVR